MILSQPELRNAVKQGQIGFDPPLEDNQWGEASIDLRLGFRFTKLTKLQGVKISVAGGLSTALGKPGFWETMDLTERNKLGQRNSFSLEPASFILGMTLESVKVPNNLIARVEGRSTYARVGLSMHQTAPWIQLGWSGQIILEITNNGPNTIELTPIIDRPCQLTFYQLTSALTKNLAYGSRDSDVYQNQEHPLDQSQKSRKK